MSLMHTFGIVAKGEKDYEDKKAWKKCDYKRLKTLLKNKVELHDDVISYIADSLRWIRWFDPFTQNERDDLSYYGITVLPGPSADHAAEIFNSWAAIFALSPKELVLTGSYTWMSGEPLERGRYQKLRLDRDRLVSSLKAMTSACSRVASSSGSEYLLHFGI
jgi:hypothetical protein